MVRDGIGQFFLEEVNKDYVRTARSKGFKESQIMLSHVLKCIDSYNDWCCRGFAFLVFRKLDYGIFFCIPGLGSYTIEAIRARTLRL